MTASYNDSYRDQFTSSDIDLCTVTCIVILVEQWTKIILLPVALYLKAEDRRIPVLRQFFLLSDAFAYSQREYIIHTYQKIHTYTCTR